MDNNHTFLQSIANYYYQILKTDSSSICFVFPGQRAAIFFTDYLSRLSDRPIFSPKTITINDLFTAESKLLTTDTITLLFELHRTYCQVTGRELPFDEFLPWGEMILSDFEDIDKYLVDARQLFRNLAEYRELDDDYSHLTDNQRRAIESFWGTFQLENLSSHQNKFLETWEKLHDIYTVFQSNLRRQNIAYPGMIYREVAEKIDRKELSDSATRYAFIGFNALTTSEHKLFNHLQKQKRADFFWDYSTQILPPDRNGAPQRGPGMFLHENIIRYPSPGSWNLPLNAHQPHITITAVAHPMEQSAEITSFLEQEYTQNERSAVVLTDENMLLPALYSLPDQVKQVNVTMGYPLKSSPAFGLVDLLYQLQKNSRDKDGETLFYHKNILPLLQHPYISLASGKAADSLRNEMTRNNRINIPSSAFNIHPLLCQIFMKVESAMDLTQYLTNIIGSLYALMTEHQESAIHREFLHSLYTAVNRFDTILRKNSQIKIESETWFRLFRSIAETETVSFKGEPLEGLQVMGILETRAIDFDKLIILDMNEGIFPKKSANNTFIPYGLRVGFGLPTIEFQDSIFAYYFFRLIHRAQKVELLYSSSVGGEMSRFLFQLIYEFGINPEIKTAVQPVNLLDVPALRIKKDNTIVLLLNAYREGGSSFLSPSSLSLYIECPLKFYFEKIAKIKETEEVAEEADARIFGKIFHEILEIYYKRHKNEIITTEMIDQWLKESKALNINIMNAFKNNMGHQSGMVLEGKNLLIYEVIKSYIVQFFRKEKEIAPFTFVDAERKVEQIYVTPQKNRVKIGGLIDRMHEKDGIIHIIDYKTGSGHSYVETTEQLFSKKDHKTKKAIFQTLLYCLILNNESKISLTIRPGISWMKKLFSQEYATEIILKAPRRKEMPQLTFENLFEQYEAQLGAVIDELFDEETDFCQTEHKDTCKYCLFKDLCNR